MSTTPRRGWPALVLAVLAGCASPPPCALPEPEEVDRPNLLVVVLDDVGIDQLSAYDVGPLPVPTPTLDCLCDRGLRFDQAWAAPLCSPARSALLAGVHARRDGLGNYLHVERDDWELPLSRTTLPEALAPAGYGSAFLGKWHVATFEAPTGTAHPNAQGFGHFAGTMGNLAHGLTLEGDLDYGRWEHLEDGVMSERTGYVTSATVDDALDAIAALPEPWLVVVSLHAPHAPLHAPPGRLVHTDLPDEPAESDLYRAMLEAADTELGRLLREVEPEVLARTQLWTMSDNGSPRHAILPPLDPARSKGSLFEGGVRVPLVVAGVGVGARGQATDALVSLVDLLPTLAEVGGATVADDLDGASLVPLLGDPDRPHHGLLYADISRAEGRVVRAVRSPDLKVVEADGGKPEAWVLGPGLEETRLESWRDADVDPLLEALHALALELDP